MSRELLASTCWNVIFHSLTCFSSTPSVCLILLIETALKQQEHSLFLHRVLMVTKSWVADTKVCLSFFLIANQEMENCCEAMYLQSQLLTATWISPKKLEMFSISLQKSLSSFKNESLKESSFFCRGSGTHWTTHVQECQNLLPVISDN